MFDLSRSVHNLPRTNKPLRIAVRQFRWFKEAFHAHAVFCGETMACAFSIDDVKLAGAFVRWLDSIDRQKPKESTERREFFEFVPSLVLRELVADMPVKATRPPANVDPISPEAFWPEGYVATTFCLTVYAATMGQEFHRDVHVSQIVDDLRSWWSFRENAREDSDYAAGFFQLLLGNEPNWWMPGSFGARTRSARDEVLNETVYNSDR
ncbi:MULTISPECIES: hypothetical protein [unclassified Rhizobium]|uniref:hypothetical protein n=1 Tax=unclassified Rhizobium TaxID=2613769 RepID=UPI0008291DD1|nr:MULTISPECIES: hypothetical protein [unclassified Rhizobium]OCJ08666.1 hypothetical protein A6U86_27530 [Rhizobium sp. AC27/96]TIX93455.1 hypothetical protein BSK43_000675 [Rhizobium sp. P44RR-XXIV]